MKKLNVIPGGGKLLRSKFAKTAVETKVVECYGVLKKAEADFTPGRVTVRAVLRTRLKRKCMNKPIFSRK